MSDAALDATALAALVRAGEASPVELVDEAIGRIEKLDPQLNAVIHRRFEAARAEAASADLPDGPFRGVPFLVKDLECHMAGEPHHQGLQVLKDVGWTETVDSHLYERFRAAGLVTLGRTNTPELGGTVTTEPVAYGPTRNPWSLGHSTGGSSGGSAAAVAAGYVPLAHANDGGGSIRIPAANCGLVGLKPTRGRITKGPHSGESWAGATIDGVVSRTVRDTAAALDAIAGPAVGDPYFAAPPARPYVQEVGTDPGSLRVGFLTAIEGHSVHPECVAAVEGAARLLESLGHRVEATSPGAFWEDGLADSFTVVVAAGAARDLDRLSEKVGRAVDPFELEFDNALMASIGRSVTAPQYIAAIDAAHAWSRRLQAWWTEYDVLLTPVLAVPPPELGWLRDPEHGTARLLEILLFTVQANVSGQPAVSLPLHWTPDGLPVGVQAMGAYGREDVLLRLAAQVEQAAPWADRHPPLFG